MSFDDTQIHEATLLMRRRCSEALADAQSSDPATAARGLLRAQLFAEAAADLAETTVEVELRKASGEAEPTWAMQLRSQSSAL